MKSKLKKVIQFIVNPRLLLCIAIAWLITNGWSYILLGIGTYLHIGWMTTVAGAYIAFLWLPISPEMIRRHSPFWKICMPKQNPLLKAERQKIKFKKAKNKEHIRSERMCKDFKGE